MIAYKVNGKECLIYEVEETPDSIRYKDDWRGANEGDWVLTDDSRVIQVLKTHKTGKVDFIRTCTGTYKVSKDSVLDTVKKKDIYSLSGKSSYQKVIDRKIPTQSEKLFAMRVSRGETPKVAYMTVFPTKSEDTAKKKSAILIKTERIQKLMKQDLKDVFDKLDASTEKMVDVVWDIAQNGKNDSDRLKAAGMMWDAADLVEKRKITEIAGVFQGFDLDKIEAAKRPIEITDGE